MRMSFPLYTNDGKPAPSYSKWNREQVSLLLEAINSGELRLVNNKCLCNNEHPEKDVIVSEKDRFGLPIRQVLCSKCGLIRSECVFDEESNNHFYAEYYRKIYPTKENQNPETNFHKGQIPRGNRILEIVSNLIPMEDVEMVADIGCSSGGVAYPFLLKGKQVVGFDFCEPFLEYGRSIGLNLCYGDYFYSMEDNSCDLMITNHSFEHLLNPLEEMKKMISKIKISKYLFMEVPGIYCIEGMYKDPLTYFQNAHVYNYYERYLRVLFERFNMKVVYGDERCTFICQKTSDEIPDVKLVYDESLVEYPKKNANYLLECKKRYESKAMRHRLYDLACKFGWKKVRPYVKRKCNGG